MKKILTCALLVVCMSLDAQLNKLFTRSDVVCTKNTNALIKYFASSKAKLNRNLLPYMITKKDSLQAFLHYQAYVRREPVKQFALDDAAANINEQLDSTVCVFSRTNKNILLVYTKGSDGMSEAAGADETNLWISLAWKTNVWEIDCGTFYELLILVPGDVLYKPEKTLR